uniref:Putative secreted protein n=1 Tax=Anopheles marajoara TaxID=58244 RepID=A0A2M4CBP1_9DIPT
MPAARSCSPRALVAVYLVQALGLATAKQAALGFAFGIFAEEVTLLRNVNCATAKYKQPAVRPRTALFGLVWITVRTTGEGAVDLV